MLKKLKELLRRDPEQFRIPRSVQEVIPIRTVWKSGIFLVGTNRYSRTWQFSDINYALAGEEDQKSMLLGYSGLLNLCDSNASTKFSVVTRNLNRRDFEDYIMIPYANDGHDHYRREYNAMLLEKASHASGMIRDMYITVTITRKSYKDAESYFVRAGAEFTLALSRLGSRCTELNMMDRLRVLHGFYRHGEEADFHFDPALSMKLGHSFQDYICPDSFEFDRDHFRMGDRYGRVLFLKDYAAYLRDDILSELSGIDRPMILSIDVVPIPMDKAIRDSESRLLGVERNIVDFLRKQQANNNFSGTVPYDMEKQRAEMKEFLDDLTIRDQRMMLGMVTLVHTADSKEQLDADTDYGVGVLVVQDGRFLCGTRQKEGSISGPGGHIEAGESPEDAAIRETQEEFGIKPKGLIPVAFLSDLKLPYCPSHVFLCTDFDGSIRCADGEMTSPGFITAEKVAELSTQNPERLFPPFAQSITALLDVLSSNPGLTSDAQNAKMKDRMDFNEADHPRDENGQFAEGEGSSSGSTESGPAVSPEGENVPCTGFAFPARLEDHATRHGLAEMGYATKEEYQQKGIDFLKQPCGGDVIGYARPDGVVVRFNTKTTEYATGVPGGPLKTYMKAKCNRKTGEARSEVAMKYYEFNREKDLKEVDDEQGS